VTTRLLLALVIGALAGPVAGQGLGGAAREEARRRERQKADGREARVYSNEDLPSAALDAGSETTVAGKEAPPEVPGIGATSADEAERLRERLDAIAARRRAEERQWRARASAARAAVEAAREEHDAVCKSGGFFVGGG
jgi:hypothetical protein